MPAATTRAALIAVTDREWRKLCALMDRVDPELAVQPFEDGWSIRDVLGHRAHWIGLFFQWLDEGRAGGPVEMPDHGVKWNQLKPYNARLRAANADLEWPEARARLERAQSRLRAYLEVQSDESLYGAPMQGGTGWTPGRYAEAAGPSHYRSAAKFIRACLRSAAAPG